MQRMTRTRLTTLSIPRRQQSEPTRLIERDPANISLTLSSRTGFLRHADNQKCDGKEVKCVNYSWSESL
jgi:hypothetical protein